jgi:hypothetical protein
MVINSYIRVKLMKLIKLWLRLRKHSLAMQTLLTISLSICNKKNLNWNQSLSV